MMPPFKKITEIKTFPLNYCIKQDYVIPTRQKLKKNDEKVV